MSDAIKKTETVRQPLMIRLAHCAESSPALNLNIAMEIARWAGEQVGAPIPNYTGSMDAAIGLLPPNARDKISIPFWRVGNDGEGADPSLFKAEVVVCHGITSHTGRGVARSAPAALCIAALIATQVLPEFINVELSDDLDDEIPY